MRNNETGEFELVVGNRQLLSGFFIVVMLFGVFFAMGYIVGPELAPSAKMAGDRRLRRCPSPAPRAARSRGPGSAEPPAADAGSGSEQPQRRSRAPRDHAADHAAGRATGAPPPPRVRGR